MVRKIVSMFTLVAFMVLSVSCVYYKYLELKGKEVTQWKGKKLKIIEVEKKSGEIIEFSEKNPAYVQKDKIVGIDITGTQLSIPLSEVECVTVMKSDKTLSAIGTVILSALILMVGGLLMMVVQTSS